MKINIMKLKLTALLLVLYTGLYAQNKIVLTAPRLDTSSLSNRINLKANTNLNNVNGVLSSTYGGAGSVSGILKANGSGVVSAASAGDMPNLSGSYVDLVTGQTVAGIKTFTTNGFTLGNSGASTHPLIINTNSVQQSIKIIGTSDNGYIQFFKSDGTTYQGYLSGQGTALNFGVAAGDAITINSDRTTTFSGALSGTSLSMSGEGLFGGAITDGTNKLKVTGPALFSSSVTAASLIKSGGTSTQALIADGSVQTLTSGTYGATPVGVANVTAITNGSFYYTRVGSIVTVSGVMDVEVTSNETATTIAIPLPVSSNFTAEDQCSGYANLYVSTSGGQVGKIVADATNDRAIITLYPYFGAGVATQTTLTFSYRVI